MTSDGAIVAWGNNEDGQTNVPAPNSGFLALAAGEYHSLGLKTDGSIVAWGSNEFSQRNVPAPNSGFVAVAANRSHNLGLKGEFGDANADGWVDLDDMAMLADCLSEPAVLPPLGCAPTRMDPDWDVDLADFAALQNRFGSQ